MAEIKQMKTLRFSNSDITYELVDAEARAQIATIEEEIATLDNGGFGVVVPYEGVFLSDMANVSIPISIQAISIPRAKYDLLMQRPNMALILELANPEEFAVQEPTITCKQFRKTVTITPSEDEGAEGTASDMYQQEIMLFCYSSSICMPSDVVVTTRDPLTAYVVFNTPEDSDEVVTGMIFGGVLFDGLTATRFDYPITVDEDMAMVTIHSAEPELALAALSGIGWFYMLIFMSMADDVPVTPELKNALGLLLVSDYKIDAGFIGTAMKPVEGEETDDSATMSLLFPRCVIPNSGLVGMLAAISETPILRYKWFASQDFPLLGEIEDLMSVYMVLDLDESQNFLGTAHLEMCFDQGVATAFSTTDEILEMAYGDMPTMSKESLPTFVIADNKPYLKQKYTVDSNTEYDYIPMNLDCEVVSELPAASKAEADLNKLYSLNDELYKAYFYQTSHYDYPLTYYSSTSSLLPQSITGRACAMIGSDIYIFGGNIRDKASEDDTTITWLNGGYKLDYYNSVRTDLNLDFGEVALDSCAAAVVGTNIYIGTDTHFWKFDTTTNTLTAMDWALESGMAVGSNMLTAINNILYFVSTDSTIISINVDTNEILVHTDVLPSGDYYGANVVKHNNMIYVVGGRSSNQAYVFNSSTSETDAIDLSFIGSAYYDFSTVVFGDDILCFGGTIPTQNAETGEWTNTHTTNSYKINITNKTCEAFTTSANYNVARESVAVTSQDLVYFVGGRYSSGSRSQYIYKYQFTTEIIDHTGWTQLTRTGSGSGEGSSVEANPADAPTDTLSTVKINGTTYSLPSGESSEGGTTVTPNPTLSGSETVLTGLTIDGTNYRMPEITVDETYVADALSNFLADEIEPKLEDKQDTLVSGTNIKTINGTSILGSGNISIEGGSGSGTTVEANPTLSGSEADLTSIAIDGTNYKLSSGSAINIVPITESLTWDETAITLTKERYDELMAASHISVALESSTLIFNATAQNSGLKTFISTIFEGSLYCFMVILMEDPEGTYNLIGARTLITTNPTMLTSGNIPVAIDGGMIEDSGVALDSVATVDYVDNKISFIVNDDNTLDLIIG